MAVVSGKAILFLDKKALAAYMGYIDLNIIRANIAKTPEDSDYTLIQQRIHAAITASNPKICERLCEVSA
ncbi:hypothetical protein GL2_24640 [Microbulbifer sp. GL-2]|nr:hypothetical protein GL2_24640 [Microbulbifer sp. GL-2]